MSIAPALAGGAASGVGSMLTKAGLEELLNRYMDTMQQGGTDKYGIGRALSARYDERSQILYELNKPVVTTTATHRSKRGSVTTTFTLSKLELLLMVGVAYAYLHDFPIASKVWDWLGVDDDPLAPSNGNGNGNGNGGGSTLGPTGDAATEWSKVAYGPVITEILNVMPKQSPDNSFMENLGALFADYMAIPGTR